MACFLNTMTPYVMGCVTHLCAVVFVRALSVWPALDESALKGCMNHDIFSGLRPLSGIGWAVVGCRPAMQARLIGLEVPAPPGRVARPVGEGRRRGRRGPLCRLFVFVGVVVWWVVAGVRVPAGAGPPPPAKSSATPVRGLLRHFSVC